ncbi:MAG: 50S ribosome-binding GTPase [Planctomycetota bacterium]|nr:50S ribosome-binding GTPase [Planctomycetota bacterium]
MRLLTPYGLGGIAVLFASSGPERDRLIACLRDARNRALLTTPLAPPRRGALWIEGTLFDEVLVVDRRDGLELHVHGSPRLLDELALRFGPWEPSVSSPAESLLMAAMSVAQLDLALEQSTYDFAAFLAALQREPLAQQKISLAAALLRSCVARALVVPHRLVLAGRQNAGKSTLFNRLLFSERALTGSLPGLTRDPLREVTCLEGYPYELVDVAGAGEAIDSIDAKAQARARAEQAAGELLIVVDGSLGPTDQDRALWSPQAVVVVSKADLPPAAWPEDFPVDLRVACADPASAGRVRAALGAVLQKRRRLPVAGVIFGPAALSEEQWCSLRAAAGAAGLDSA